MKRILTPQIPSGTSMPLVATVTTATETDSSDNTYTLPGTSTASASMALSVCGEFLGCISSDFLDLFLNLSLYTDLESLTCSAFCPLTHVCGRTHHPPHPHVRLDQQGPFCPYCGGRGLCLTYGYLFFIQVFGGFGPTDIPECLEMRYHMILHSIILIFLITSFSL